MKISKDVGSISLKIEFGKLFKDEIELNGLKLRGTCKGALYMINRKEIRITGQNEKGYTRLIFGELQKIYYRHSLVKNIDISLSYVRINLSA